MNRDEFFALLDQLTPAEIEARLSTWDNEQLSLVQEYLEQRRTEVAPSDQSGPITAAAALTAAQMATRANTTATVAIIVSIGAMAAAVAAAVIALLGLRYE